MKHITRISAALAAGAIIALAVPTAAQAHVSAGATSTAAGSRTVVTFSVPHGCEGSPTQVVTIDIPESIVSVTPTVNPLWTVEKVAVPLDEPIESEYGGDPITERIGQVVYTSTSGGLAEGFRDTFELSLQLPAGEAGDVVEFPVTQTCTEGTAVWEGDDVPAITLTAAAVEGDGHGGDHGTDADTAGDVTADAASTEGSIDLVARIIGVLGIVIGIAGITAAVLTRRSVQATR
ncbi:YcnI family copper-binding membrane protein [Microcella sp.]|uniref:YcnI family copper-binding membrane protein n=1 Tax=Microcella sp. TaxID=1913979 RepID=UPI003F71A81D